MNVRQLLAIALAIAALGATALAQAPDYTKLANLWLLNGSTVDSYGPNDGVFDGTATYVAGPRPGTQAAYLAGSSFIKAGSKTCAFDTKEPFSVTAWINGPLGQDSAIVGKLQQGGSYTGWELHVGTGAGGSGPGLLNVWLINSFGPNYIQVNSPQLVLDDTWHHVAFTYDGSGSAAGVRIYVDGQDATGDTTADTLTGTLLNDVELGIGTRQNGANHNFQGSIAEVSSWRATLSAANIGEIFQKGVQPPANYIRSFQADNSLVYAGQSATLTWQLAVAGATVSLDHGIGDVTALTTNSVGSIQVAVETDTTYTLTVTKGTGAPQTKSVTVAVKPLISSFAASRNPVPRGVPTALAWAINPLATNVWIAPAVGSVSDLTTNGFGNLTVSLTNSTTYTLMVARNGVTNQTSLLVTVNELLPATMPDINTLLSAWALNGNTHDTIGVREGQFVGNSNYVAGPDPGTMGALLDGGSYINTSPPFGFDQNTPFSATAWVKGDAANNDTAILGQMSAAGPFAGWELHVGAPASVSGPGAGALNVWLINAFGTSYIQVNSTNVVLDGSWHHVAFTYDGSSAAAGVRIYVDGQNATGEATADFLAGPFANSLGLSIGSRQGTADFKGGLSSVSIWNTNLTEQNIASIFQSGLPMPNLLLSFSADNYLVYPGQAVKLSWQVAPGASVSIDSGVGDVTGATTNGFGSRVVTVQAGTTFTLTATKQGRSETRPVTVNVRDYLTSFGANRLTIPQGGSAHLSWVISPLATAQLTPGIGSLSGYTTNGVGSLWVSPAVETTFTFSATYGGNTTQTQVMVAVTSPLPAKAPALTNLVSIWPLNGDTRDAVGGHDGTFVNFTDYVSGPLPATLGANLVGTNWLTSGSGTDPWFSFDRTQPFSATAWINGPIGQDTTIMGKMQQGGSYAGWELHVGTGTGGSGAGLLNVWIISAFGPNYIQVNSPQVVLDGTWHHVGFTYDGSSSGAGVRIYVDGEDATGTIAADSLSASITNGVQMTIGARDNGRNHRFTGAIHDAAVWSTALTGENMRYIYAQGAPVPPSIRLGTPHFTAPSSFSFSWSSVAGKTYQVEGSADLKLWTPVATTYPAGGAVGAVTSYTNTASTSAVQFYRVRPSL